MKKKLRVGVIGVGHLGQHHARLYAGLPESALAGVFDVDLARARTIAERYQTRVFEDLSSLLKEVDAVSVATPTSTHHAVVTACLQSGVHVLVEKPIAVTSAEARELVSLADRQRIVLQVGHIERFNPGLLALRPFIRRPAFIECHRLAPFGERGTDVDVVLDLMIHDLDMVLSFEPGPVEEIRAAGVPVLSPNVDIANARLAFQSGCVANLTASRVSLNRLRRLRVFQRDGYLSMDYQTRQGMIHRRTAAAGRRPSLQIEQVRGGDEEPLRLQLEAFLRSVTTGSRPVVSGADGAAALDLAHRVLEAIQSFVQRHGGEEGVTGQGGNGRTG